MTCVEIMVSSGPLYRWECSGLRGVEVTFDLMAGLTAVGSSLSWLVVAPAFVSTVALVVPVVEECSGPSGGTEGPTTFACSFGLVCQYFLVAGGACLAGGNGATGIVLEGRLRIPPLTILFVPRVRLP